MNAENKVASSISVTINRIVSVVLAGLILAGTLAMVGLRGDVNVQASVIGQHEKRLDASETDRQAMRECLAQMQADIRETKVLLQQLLRQGSDSARPSKP